MRREHLVPSFYFEIEYRQNVVTSTLSLLRAHNNYEYFFSLNTREFYTYAEKV